MNRWLSAAATVAVLFGGCLVLWAATDGGAAWTAEAARRLDIAEQPRVLPDAALRDIGDRPIGLTALDRPIAVVDFIFTRCPTVCVDLGSTFRDLQGELVSRDWQDKVGLLSLTFDYAHDGPVELAGYLERFGAAPDLWNAARFEREAELDAVLRELGVVVIPEPNVGFVHNTAIYLVDRGRVVGIFDFGDRSGLLQAIEWRLKTS